MRVNLFVGLLAVAAIIYLLAVRFVLRRGIGSRRALMLVLATAVLMRVPPLLGPPFLSSDVYRYVWDGRVQNAGVNPYRYIPADPALSGLRDAAVYPHINRREYAPTIYPPAAQLVFAVVERIADSVLAMRLAMVGFETLAIAALMLLLARAGLEPSRVLIYAWNPLAAWCFAGNGHVDAIAVGLIALTLLLRTGRRDGWAGVAFGAAVLVKFLPAVLAPALWRRWGWRFVATSLATVGALYACYAGVGWRVFGFLHSYGSEEGISSGGGVWLLAGLAEFGPLPRLAAPAYLAAAAASLVGFGAWAAFAAPAYHDVAADTRALCWRTSVLAAMTLVELSPHYPWYFPWLAVPACVAPSRAVIWLGVAPLVLYLDPLHERFIWPSLIYGPVLMLTLRDLARPRSTRPTR